ncbi:MAG: hypothetical protein Q4Q58_02150 [Thermoplasmata archaeon]|nr:hypothetical protein [Thermoplasmata archaeon]
MPPSKYERELRFIDTEVARLNRYLQSLVASMPASPGEAAEKADEVLGIQDKIAELINRKREIEESFIKAGMDIPNIDRSMNATVHNAGAFEVRSSEEAEALAAAMAPSAKKGPEPAAPEMDDINSQIRSIGDELRSVEDRIVQAEIDGDDDEKQKLEMMASSLRSRRDTLVQEAKQMKASAAPAPAPAAAAGPDPETEKRLSALEDDTRALRAQVSDVRTGMQDVKDQLRQIMSALGIEEDD